MLNAGFPLHSENRENGENNSGNLKILEKHREFENFEIESSNQESVHKKLLRDVDGCIFDV